MINNRLISFLKEKKFRLIQRGNTILLTKNNREYKLDCKNDRELLKLFKSMMNGGANTNNFNTKNFMSIQTWFDPSEEQKCIDSFRQHRQLTNPRFHNFKQMYFTAGDQIDFEKFGMLPIRLNFTGKINHSATIIKDNMFKSFKLKLPTLYKKFDLDDILESFDYLFNKFQKGVLVVIKDNKLKVFLPFFNTKFINSYYNLLYFDDTDKREMEELYELKNKKKLSTADTKRMKHLYYITGKRVEDFYKSKGEKYKGIIKDRTQWLANDCVFVNQFWKKTEMGHGVNEYHYLFTELLRTRKVNDAIFFLSYRDIPILKNNKTEPYEKLYNNKSKSLENKLNKVNIVPICTPSTGKDYATIPLITDETIKRISNKIFPKKCKGGYTSNDLKGLEKSWSKKKDIAFFRGGSTGCGVTVEGNVRLKLAKIAQDNPKLIDGGITNWNARIKKTENGKLDIIDPSKLPFGLIDEKNNVEKSKYKYIINVEGHSAAYRLNFEMGLGSVLLVVESKYHLWFQFLLEPYKNYIPIKHDLSDLIEKIEWCKKHDKECKVIATNAKKLYDKYLEKEGCLDYMQLIIHQMSKLMKINLLNSSLTKKSIALITIYRDTGNGLRSKQRDKFLKIMPKLLEPWCKFKIYVIEQEDDGNKFNIGKLKNIGFEKASKDKEYDNYIFTDIDMIPDSKLLPYYLKEINGFMELAIRGTRYDHNKFPFLGAVISCDDKSFKKVNGYPNNYWGWGNEDIDLTHRIIDNGVVIFTPKEGMVIDLETDNEGHLIPVAKKMEKLKREELKNEDKKAKTLLYKDIWKKNGLSSLQYKILKTEEISGNVVQYKVDLLKTKDEKKYPQWFNIKKNNKNNISTKYRNLRQKHIIKRKYI